MNNKKIFIFFSLIILSLVSSPLVQAGTYAEDKKQAEAYADEIIGARSLASETLVKSHAKITEKAFVGTYGKVYGRIQGLKQKKGYIVTFSAIKYRNPRNAATPFEARLISRFKYDRAFKKFWTVTMVQGRSYSRLIKPLFAKKTCLACHGARERRPAFIAKRYPKDKSFAFKEGEIMGLISIYMPDEE